MSEPYLLYMETLFHFKHFMQFEHELWTPGGADIMPFLMSLPHEGGLIIRPRSWFL